jgi:large subunit ribosomal protein L15
VRLDQIAKLEAKVIDLEALKQAGMIDARVLRVKVIASGELGKAVTLKGVLATKGARKAIEDAGGKIEE